MLMLLSCLMSFGTCRAAGCGPQLLGARCAARSLLLPAKSTISMVYAWHMEKNGGLYDEANIWGCAPENGLRFLGALPVLQGWACNLVPECRRCHLKAECGAVRSRLQAQHTDATHRCTAACPSDCCP